MIKIQNFQTGIMPSKTINTLDYPNLQSDGSVETTAAEINIMLRSSRWSYEAALISWTRLSLANSMDGSSDKASSKYLIASSFLASRR